MEPNLHVVASPLAFPFEENRGQGPADVTYLLRAGSLRAAFGSLDVSYTVLARDPTTPDASAMAGLRSPPGPVRTHTVTQVLVGARPAMPVGSQPSPMRVNYLRGSQEQWLTDVPTFDQLVRSDAWAGIDVLYVRNGAGVESTYVVAPGADPGQIQLAWHGGEAHLAEDGGMHLKTPLGEIQETAPVAWQERGDQTIPVAVRWVALDLGADESVWGFRLDAYDPSVPLIIDPTVFSYGSYIGGNQSEAAAAVAVDSSGAAYIVGSTVSDQTTFPNGTGFAGLSVPGFDQIYNAGIEDAFVVKLAPDGRSLVYATYIGGNSDDQGNGIAIDSSGAAYVVGTTTSAQGTFPNGTGFAGLGVPGFDQTFNGVKDAFVVKLAPDGRSLLYATYLGGTGSEEGIAIAVDSAGAAYVTGLTDSPETSFPDGDPNNNDQMDTPGFDQTFNAGGADAFVVKLAPNGQSLLYATYIGGSGNDLASSIAVDKNGAAYVTGSTTSSEATFPNGTGLAALGAPGFDLFYNLNGDAFVIKLAPTGQTLDYATYIGGSGNDSGAAVTVDSSGAAYLTGDTSSSETSFPNGAGLVGPGFDPSFNGGEDAFVVKLTPSGQNLVYMTYLGGSGIDFGTTIAIDSSGAAYVAGVAGSNQGSFPNGGGLVSLGVPGFDQTHNGVQDAFVVKLAPDGQSLSDATYLGGSGIDVAQGIAVDSTGAAYVVGSTLSDQTTFPNGAGLAGLGAPGVDQTYNGGQDAYVVKLGPTLTPTSTLTPTVTLTPTATETVTPTATLTPTSTLTPVPTTTPFACGPRPTVGVGAIPVGGGRLQVTVSSGTAPATPGNHLIQLQATIPVNARIDVPNGPQDLAGDVVLPIVGNGTQPVIFFVRRVGPGAVTVPLVATDTCGAWPSFVGGGPGAF